MNLEKVDGSHPNVSSGDEFYVANGKVGEVCVDFTCLFQMLFDQMDTQIELADSKASLILTANAILIASITLDQGMLRCMFDQGTSLVDRLIMVITLCMMVSLFLSVLYALFTTRPNLIPPGPVNNLFFWGHVARMPEADYRTQFMNMTIEEVKLAVITQIHTRSRVVAKKYVNVRYSLDFLFVALVLFIISRILSGLA